MPDSLLTLPPRWHWYIASYFFVGGIAGGAFFLASLLRLFGADADRPVARLGHYVALTGGVVSGALLTLDLTRPERFWHMLLQAPSGLPLLKPWSPMSVGAWGLLAFSGLAALATAGSLGETGRPRWRWAAGLARGPAGSAIAVLGGLAGLFLAGYTGVLLAVTNRPLWSDSSWLGLLFLLSGLSTGTAVLAILGRRRAAASGTLDWLAAFDHRALGLELAALVAYVISLGPLAGALVGWWGVLLVVGVVGAGILAPWSLERRWRATAPLRAPVLVLVGGLLLRVLVVFASEGMGPPSMVAGP